MSSKKRKLMFMTTDESLISRLSSLQSKETDLIELDDSIEVKKPSSRICTICGDRANGFNYDVLSCSSCKTFFRRNAFKDLTRYQCLNSVGRCTIDFRDKRKCFHCRLKKCYDVGMRKDFIRADSSKSRENSFERETNRCFIEQFTKQMLNEDNKFIERIRDLFVTQFNRDKFCCPNVEVNSQTSALLSWSNCAKNLFLVMIDYFKKNEHFQTIIIDDQLKLIKNNLFRLVPLIKCFNYQTNQEFNANWVKLIDKHQRYLFSNDVQLTRLRKKSKEIIDSLVGFTRQDPIIISLLMVIFLVSLDSNRSFAFESHLDNSIIVYRIQSYYIELMNNYLRRFLDEQQIAKMFLELVRIDSIIQETVSIFTDHIRSTILSENFIDQLNPLLGNLLRLK